MAYDNPDFVHTFKCSTAITKHYLVKMGTDANTVVICAAASTTADTDAVAGGVVGVAQETCTTDSTQMLVQHAGIAKVIAASTDVTAGATVTPDTDGKAELADFSGTNTHVFVAGIALETASAADDLVAMLIRPYVGNSQS